MPAAAYGQERHCALAEGDPALPSCESWLHASHTLDASAAAGVTAIGDTAGSLVTSSARADLGYTIGFGPDIDIYQLSIEAGVTGSRFDGVVSGFGAATRLALRGSVPAPPIDPRYKNRYNMAGFPAAFDLEHHGDLNTLPKLSASADVARGTYTSQQVSLRMPIVRITALDEDKSAVDPRDRVLAPSSFDLLPLWGAVDATLQADTRLAITSGGALMGVKSWGRWTNGSLEFLAVEQHALVGDFAKSWTEFWPVRVEFIAPHTGTGFRLAWGMIVSDFAWPGQHDHRDESQDIGALAIGDFDRYTGQYERKAYLTMDGNEAFEDRVSFEAVGGTSFNLVGRAFVARTTRAIAGSADTLVDWTAGVEGTGSKRVGPVDVGARVELGRSFYAALDEGMPTVGFGARAALTLSRATQRRVASR